MNKAMEWWRKAAIYQIVVPSFMDTNGDGIGDLEGVRSRLDYLRWLGVDAIWLSPVHPSPMVDLGYDVTDYCNIAPEFGSLEVMDRLIHEAHQRNLKIILDWVVNHTSDQHPWFLESRSSRDNPKRDWYLWQNPPPGGGPPNNWISIFGGSVWEWDEPTGQYYCHTFHPTQPDLNWRHPEVRAALYDSMRFWLERGIDGLRIDALCLTIKAHGFPDNPPNPDYQSEIDGPDAAQLPEHTRDQPEVHEIAAEIRRIADEHGERVLLGELYMPIEKVASYYGREQPELHLPMNMRFAWTEWTAERVGAIIQKVHELLPEGAWPSWTLSTHDCLRIAARVQGEQTRVAAMLLLTLQGTPTMYYGEEIGMTGVPIPPEDAKDPQGKRTGRNRDPERTPMQWDAGPNAGFTSGQPWLPVGDDGPTANVADQSENPHSLLTLYRRLLALRHEEETLRVGKFELVSFQDPMIAYRCTTEGRRLFVVLNFSSDEQTYHLPDAQQGSILLSTFLDRQNDDVHEVLTLRGDEGVILTL